MFHGFKKMLNNAIMKVLAAYQGQLTCWWPALQEGWGTRLRKGSSAWEHETLPSAGAQCHAEALDSHQMPFTGEALDSGLMGRGGQL